MGSGPIGRVPRTDDAGAAPAVDRGSSAEASGRAQALREAGRRDTAARALVSDRLGDLALEHERLRQLDRRRQTWSDASIETAATMLGGGEAHPLAALASLIRLIADADTVTVLRARGDRRHLEVDAVAGPTNRFAVGERIPIADSIAGAVFEARQPRLLPDGVPGGPSDPVRDGSLMAAPMRAADRAVGVFLVGRDPGGHAFDETDLGLLATFVDHATVAIELADARLDRERMVLLEDRARIARDLHDTVIQQLFAAGLELRAAAVTMSAPRPADDVLHAVALVDAAIGQIRTAVLALSPETSAGSLRHRLIDVVADLARAFPVPPSVTFNGPVDLIARADLTEDVVAVVRESLTNVAKHASAEHTGVVVRALAVAVEVEVWDDGVGMPDAPRRSGLTNLADRAARHGGSFAVTSGPPTTRAVWRVPYADEGGRDER